MLREEPNIEYRRGDRISPTNQSRDWVEQYAHNVAVAYTYSVGQSLVELVERIGGQIHFQHMDELLNVSGSLFVHGKQRFDIGLPYFTSPKRDNFTIAHELGHYFLHSDQGNVPIVAYRSGSTRIEWEANWFAAALLMPKDEFVSVSQRVGGDSGLIAHHFGVSADAAQVRKNVLAV